MASGAWAKFQICNDSGTHLTGEVLSGQVFWGLDSGAWGEQAETLPNVGQQNVTPGTTAQTITQGYHDGTGSVARDADLVSGKNSAAAIALHHTPPARAH